MVSAKNSQDESRWPEVCESSLDGDGYGGDDWICAIWFKLVVIAQIEDKGDRGYPNFYHSVVYKKNFHLENDTAFRDFGMQLIRVWYFLIVINHN